MNRWKLTKEVREKYLPIINGFLEKVRSVTDEQIDNFDNDYFTIDLSGTELNPTTLIDLMKEVGYEKVNSDENGWQWDFWIDMRSTDNVVYPTECERLCIHGTGMTFELHLSVREFM